MEGVRATATLSQYQALQLGDPFAYDNFDGQSYTYPHTNSTLGHSSASSSALGSPSLALPAVSSISPPSRRSSRTSWETSWFDEGDADMLADVDPYGIDQEPPADGSVRSSDIKDVEDDTNDTDEGLKSPSIQCNDSVMAGDDDGDGRDDGEDGEDGDEVACQFDNSDWFAQWEGRVDISDEPPSSKTLKRAGEVLVYDSAGGQRPFKSLFALGDVVGDRQLIIFIRHFYCGACRAYLSALITTVTTQKYTSKAVPTSIIVIGCGKPELIRQYKASTQCPFPIFADPSRQLYKQLGMGLNLNAVGPRRPEYMKHISKRQWVNEQFAEMAAAGKRRWMGGSVLQLGGEFLFQDGQVIWCHRMRNYRGHAEMETIKRILEIER